MLLPKLIFGAIALFFIISGIVRFVKCRKNPNPAPREKKFANLYLAIFLPIGIALLIFVILY